MGLAKVPGNGYEARQLTLRYARSEAACAAGDEVEDEEVIAVGASSTPVTLFFCQTATAVDATKVVSSATSASGTPKAGNVPKFKVKAKADGTSIKATWNIPADADIVRAHASIKEGGVAPQYGSPPPTSAVFSGLADERLGRRAHRREGGVDRGGPPVHRGDMGKAGQLLGRAVRGVQYLGDQGGPVRPGRDAHVLRVHL